jgi:glycogen debranching enzyme
MPIVLGRRLPSTVAQALVRRVQTFLVPTGLATEQPNSTEYVANGYWRGPMWAPATFLVVLGLKALGEYPLACYISLRFCMTCKRSGFAENFDAQTGAPLNDPCYTWTASVFLLLAELLYTTG